MNFMGIDCDKSAYLLNIWNYLKTLNSRFVDVGRVIGDGPIEGTTKEEVVSRLEEYAAPDFYIHPDIFNEWMVYMDMVNDRIWLLTPIKMALLFKRFDLIEPLLDKGFSVELPDDTLGKFTEETGDWLIEKKENDNGSYSFWDNIPNTSQENVWCKLSNINLFTFVATTDYRELSDDLLTKLLINNTSEGYRLRYIIQEHKTEIGDLDVKGLVRLLALYFDPDVKECLEDYSRVITIKLAYRRDYLGFGEYTVNRLEDKKKTEKKNHIKLQIQYDLIKYYLSIKDYDSLDRYISSIHTDCDYYEDYQYEEDENIDVKSGYTQLKRLITYRKKLCSIVYKDKKVTDQFFVLMLSDLASIDWVYKNLEEKKEIDPRYNYIVTDEIATLYEDYYDFVKKTIPSSLSLDRCMEAYEKMLGSKVFCWIVDGMLFEQIKRIEIPNLLSNFLNTRISLKMTNQKLKNISKWFEKAAQIEIEANRDYTIMPEIDIRRGRLLKHALTDFIKNVDFYGSPLKYKSGRKNITKLSESVLALNDINLILDCFGAGLLCKEAMDIVINEALSAENIKAIPLLLALK